MERSAEWPKPLSFPHKTTAARDASFSSYLQQQQLDKLIDDSEISIFDARKYFNDTTCPQLSKRISISPVDVISIDSVPRLSTASSADGYAPRNYRARSFHATPTASSEASWNSQTGLLSNPPGAVTVSIRNPSLVREKKKNSATKWLPKCPCAGKKSIQVENKLSESTTPTTHPPNSTIEPRNEERRIPTSIEKSFVATDWLEREGVIPNSRRISADNNRFSSTASHHRALALASSIRPPFSNDGSNGFTFPLLNQTSSPIKLTLNGHAAPPLEDPARDSLEVFRPSEDIAASSKTTMDDDIASDASSDLFEIESFSNQTTYHMYNTNRRDSMDEISPSSNGRHLYSQTECYEPSEASIDWSVTTAEAFERGSVTNFSVAASEVDQEFGVVGQSGALKKNSGKSGGGGLALLSCRHEKAVSVGPQPVKWGGTQGQRGENSTVRHVSSRPPIANKPPQLARSQLPLHFAP